MGASRLAAAERLLPAAIRQWREQWCFQCDQEPVCVCAEEGSEAMAPVADGQWKLAESSQGKLWLAADWRRLVFARFASEAPQDATAAQLVDAAQQALASGLLAALGAPTAPLQDAQPIQGGPMSARLLLRADLGGVPLLLVAEASLLAGFLPQAARALPLLPRSQAIGGARLKVKVSLPFSSLTVGEANGLRAGDILQGDTHFLEPLSLTAGAQQTIAKGYLARQGEHLALQLAAHEQ
ncbi:FliM/FliN family flagellar motor C-terminal domain-containing protein [Pseudomonas sp. CAU 1711]|uniref:FliM/FliN family flagellar motor switch protein n=1 Tax=Pseudomonas sp. CAU 1711 TaxID=3140356 RepID=UPI00325FF00D